MTYQDDRVFKHLAEGPVRSIYSVNVSSVHFFPSLVVKKLGILVWSKSLIKMGHSTKNRSDHIMKVTV